MDPWISLAAEICNRGIKENDTAFLNSDWYKELKAAVFGWEALKDNRLNIQDIKNTRSVR